MAEIQRTLVLVKPDGVRRGLVAEVLGRFERRGFRMVGLKLLHPSRSLVEEHYGEHRDKPFFGELVSFLSGGPVVAACLEGPDAVATVRTMMGKTNPLESAPGTIRGDLATKLEENVVHGSSDLDAAKREVALWFQPAELLG
ncbi:MAG: nucleoside diphosphate kinase [Fimbriimonadales bacterium]